MGILLPPLHLPPHFRPILEVRQRAERRIDRDFDERANDNRTDLLSRYRFGLDYQDKKFKARVVGQVSEDEAWTRPRNYMTERRDLRLGYGEWTLDEGKLTVGRQIIKKGTGRLLNECDWNNVGVTFDVVRWTSTRWDVFGGKLGLSFNPDHRTRLEAAAYRSALGETMVLARHDKGRDAYTLDHMATVKQGRWTLNTEWALQTGRVGDKDLEAWATANRLTYASTPQLDFYADLVAASGGGDSDTVRTFDQGFSAYHNWHGLSDVQGWRNMELISVGSRYRPTKKLELLATATHLGLRDARDAWYSGVGRPNKRVGGAYVDPTGKSGRDIGMEYAFDLKWEATKTQTVNAGIAVLRPGNFIRALSGDPQDQFYGYVMTSFRF